VPAAKTKSAPITEQTAAGKPNAQYTDDVLIKANRRQAELVRSVPAATSNFLHQLKSGAPWCKPDKPMRMTSDTRPTTNAIMKLQMMPVINIGNNLTIVRTGESPT
jgi:hypothetical protein